MAETETVDSVLQELLEAEGIDGLFPSLKVTHYIMDRLGLHDSLSQSDILNTVENIVGESFDELEDSFINDVF